MSVSISATHTPNSGSSSNTSCGAELEWGNISISFLTLVIYYLLSHMCAHTYCVCVCIGIHYICFELILFSLCVICYYCSLITIITSRVCSVRFLLFSKQTTITQSHTHTHEQFLGWTFWQVKKTLGTGRSTVPTPARKVDSLLGPLCVCDCDFVGESIFMALFSRSWNFYAAQFSCFV